MTLQGHQTMITMITGMQLSPDGSYLLTNGMDCMLRIWDMRPYAPHNRCVKIMEGHQHNVEQNLLKCGWSPDGARDPEKEKREMEMGLDDNKTQKLFMLCNYVLLGAASSCIFLTLSLRLFPSLAGTFLILLHIITIAGAIAGCNSTKWYAAHMVATVLTAIFQGSVSVLIFTTTSNFLGALKSYVREDDAAVILKMAGGLCILMFCLEWLVLTLAFFLRYHAFVEQGSAGGGGGGQMMSNNKNYGRKVVADEEDTKNWPWPFQFIDSKKRCKCRIIVPPVECKMDVSPSKSEVSMDETMSTCDSLNKPDVVYIDNNDMAAIDLSREELVAKNVNSLFNSELRFLNECSLLHPTFCMEIVISLDNLFSEYQSVYLVFGITLTPGQAMTSTGAHTYLNFSVYVSILSLEQNLLLSKNDNNSKLKIANFGFARGLAETLCASPLYMAPEIMQLHKYDAKADLWSVGAIVFQLVTGRTPFTGNNQIQLLQNIMKSTELQFPPDVKDLSSECIDLCRRQNPVDDLGLHAMPTLCLVKIIGSDKSALSNKIIVKAIEVDVMELIDPDYYVIVSGPLGDGSSLASVSKKIFFVI
ncbi:hypothetical protein L6452_12741 [Arctium lappa]|uniref:Uncharacterized protein n=1 Tax=Arctium lappa TaxID=4217 RepID=A0ACB9CG92_ARCLA|nr:hypothetical protein L6452_12741 [Arctium lappa]